MITEEINHAYDGGLYAELIQNRAFLDDAKSPVHWSVVKDDASAATIALDPANPLNGKLPTSLRLTVTQTTKDHPAGVGNSGYWGIPVHPKTQYRASLWARAEAGFSGPLTVSIVSEDGRMVYATEIISGVASAWKKFEVTLKTGNVAPTAQARFEVTLDQPGTIWLNVVSLFPPTWNDRPNCLRKDIMQMLVDLNPKFLRFPGGNYVEGSDFVNRFNWKQMIGPVEQRPGHKSNWGYWSTDGFGLPEFLGWCQDIGMEPVLAVFAGYTLNGNHVTNGPALEPYVQEALEEIEYVTGDASTKWGAQRIKDGYPNPFPLHYVEIGNEDFFDKSGSYDGRLAQFYDAIKAKYPQLQIISTAGVKSRTADLNDEHYYLSEAAMEGQSFKYDTYDRANKTKVFVGEWATQPSSPTPNMAGALGDAAWMCCMERNADVVIMHCYAPLFVNVSKLKGSDRSMQWN